MCHSLLRLCERLYPHVCASMSANAEIRFKRFPLCVCVCHLFGFSTNKGAVDAETARFDVSTLE